MIKTTLCCHVGQKRAQRSFVQPDFPFSRQLEGWYPSLACRGAIGLFLNLLIQWLGVKLTRLWHQTHFGSTARCAWREGFCFGSVFFYSEDILNSQEVGKRDRQTLPAHFPEQAEKLSQGRKLYFKRKERQKEGKKNIQPAHSFSAIQVILGHRSCLMGSLGWLWSIPAGKRECFSPLIFSELAWASQGKSPLPPQNENAFAGRAGAQHMLLTVLGGPAEHLPGEWVVLSKLFHSERCAHCFQDFGIESARVGTKKGSITIFRVNKSPANFPAWESLAHPAAPSLIPDEGFSPSQAPDFQARWWARGQVTGRTLRQGWPWWEGTDFPPVGAAIQA